MIAVHLAELMRLALARTDSTDMPGEAALESYYERNGARFAQPARLRFAHVYFARERRGGAVEADALGLAEELRSRDVPPLRTVGLGDPFVHGSELGPLSVAALSRLFGSDFAATLETAPLRQWAGPVRSAYGSHLIWVHERAPARIPDLDTVRSRVLHAYLRERSQAKLHTSMETVRARYRVETPG